MEIKKEKGGGSFLVDSLLLPLDLYAEVLDEAYVFFVLFADD